MFQHMAVYLKAYARPFQDIKKLGVGCLLFIIPFVNVITILFGIGYILRCAKSAIRNDFKLPEWRDWEQLFVDGLLFSLILMLYFLPAFIFAVIAALAAWTALLSMNTYNYAPIAVALAWAAFVAIITAYLVPIGILIYAKTGHLKSAFSMAAVLRVAFTWKYLASWTVAFFLMSLVSSLGYTLSTYLWPTIILPFVVDGALSFIVGVATVTITGSAFGDISRILARRGHRLPGGA
jgi:hypothetical protein